MISTRSPAAGGFQRVCGEHRRGQAATAERMGITELGTVGLVSMGVRLSA